MSKPKSDNSKFSNKFWGWHGDINSPQDITDAHINMAYRLNLPSCVSGACKANCAYNPYCLNGMGEKKLNNLIQKEVNVNLERDDYFRELSGNKWEYAGLVNLGATCYINTYLQVWYNNPLFREIILNLQLQTVNVIDTMDFDVKADGSVEKQNKVKLPDLKLLASDCCATNLQFMFTMMKESVRRSIDPNFFIKYCGLDENMQQDAQEFSQLFLSKLQNRLMDLRCEELCVKDLFGGVCSYITECGTCKRQSGQKTEFFELTLNIQNCTTISDCIKDLLKEEHLNEDNRYYCQNCARKVDAKRHTQISQLPPVLNLQLMRFLYDMSSKSKKKLTKNIKFSETLDLREYVSVADKNVETEYQLGAILMHVGKSAYSGHYMAHIKNFETDDWFCFNDEVITKMKKKQQLGCTEDEIESKTTESSDSTATTSSKAATSTASTKTVAKQLSTANAYLLVYYRKDLFDFKQTTKKLSELVVKNQQLEIVKNDNKMLESWFKEIQQFKTKHHETEMSGRVTVRAIYDDLWFNSSKKRSPTKQPQLYFIPTDFLKKFMLNPSDVIAVNGSMQKYLCPHKCLNPFALIKFKCVNQAGLDQMLKTYSLSLNDVGAFAADDLTRTKCVKCVKNIFAYLKLKEQIDNDKKVLKNLQREDDFNEDIELIGSLDMNRIDGFGGLLSNSNDFFWIGKESLRKWTDLAIKKIELQLPNSKFEPDPVANGSESPASTCNEVAADIQMIENIVPPSVPTSTNGDNDCIIEPDENEANLNDVNFMLNDDIKCPHGNLAPTTSRRPISRKTMEFFCKYFPANSFVSTSTADCRACTQTTQEITAKKTEIKNQKDDLLDLFNNKNRPSLSDCVNESQFYLIPAEFIKEWKAIIKNAKYKDIKIVNKSLLCSHGNLAFNENTIDYKIVNLLHQNEWLYLKHSFGFDHEITVQKIDDQTFIFNPFLCEQCMQERENNKLYFENKKITIRQHDDPTAVDDVQIIEVKETDFENARPTLKRVKRLNDDDEDSLPPVAVATANGQLTERSSSQNNIVTRRSKRSKRFKNDLEVVTSSLSTIRDIKLKIATSRGKLISEQKLFLAEQELENDLTVFDYKISPGDVLILKIDKTVDDFDYVSSDIANQPEVGFKGTNLF